MEVSQAGLRERDHGPGPAPERHGCQHRGELDNQAAITGSGGCAAGRLHNGPRRPPNSA